MSRNLIEFELRAIEDRARTLESGHYSVKDVEFVKITQYGGKHSVEKEVTQDQLNIWKNNPDLKYIHDHYIAWKDNLEAPVVGHPLKEWPILSPAQLKSCLKLGIRAVEELAQLSDGQLPFVGQGARAIRDKAREWLSVSANQGKILEEISELKNMVIEIKERNQRLEEENKELKIRLEEKRKKQ